MSNPTPRSKVKQNQTWNAESVFYSPDAFEAEAKSILKSLPNFKKYQGHLGDNPDTFIKAMKAADKLSMRAAKVRVYATMSSSVDSTDQSGAAMNEKAMNLMAQINATTAFIEPEMLSIGKFKLRKWLKDTRIWSCTSTFSMTCSANRRMSGMRKWKNCSACCAIRSEVRTIQSVCWRTPISNSSQPKTVRARRYR